MQGFRELFFGILNPRLLLTVVLLAAVVIVIGALFSRSQKKQRAKPGQLLHYECPARSESECRSLLSHKNKYDTLAYTLATAEGGYYITFEEHLPTQQPLATVFLLQFTQGSPARFTLQFVREAFGMREPVLSEAVLDEFFAQKLGAGRIETPFS